MYDLPSLGCSPSSSQPASFSSTVTSNGMSRSYSTSISEQTGQSSIDDVPSIKQDDWLADIDKLNAMKTLKELVYGNCRLLYGSEKFKFYDIVIGEDEQAGNFSALLTVNQNMHTKILRREVSSCPIDALRRMVQRIQKDTAVLLNKYSVGSQIKGQQGYTDKETGKFELLHYRKDERLQGPDDDTSGLVSRYSEICDAIPKRQWVDNGSNKRARVDSMEYDLKYEDSKVQV